MRQNPKRPLPAFTLIELLAVIAIGATLTALSLPSLSVLDSWRFTNSVDQIKGAFALARSTAMARNTYAWVGLLPSEPGKPADVMVAFVASANGERDLSAANLKPITRPFRQPGLVLIPPLNVPEKSETLAASEIAFECECDFAPTTFTQVVEFNPSGEANIRLASNPRWIQFDLQAERNSRNRVAVQVSGITGRISTQHP